MHLNTSFRPLLMIAAVSTLGVSTLSLPNLATAELSASFGAANLYLFRGLNFSGSAPQVHGSLDYEQAGFYAGIWGSSESDRDDDGTSGQEYDVYAGFKGEMSGLSYNFNLTAYEYPQEQTDNGGNSLGDASEFILSLGMGGFGLSIVDGLNQADYMYYTLGFETEQFGITFGMNDDSDANTDYTHLDLSFFATEELSFTLSTIIDDDPEDTYDHDTLFVVGWTKSFEL